MATTPNTTAKTSRAAVMIMLFSCNISGRLDPLVADCEVEVKNVIGRKLEVCKGVVCAVVDTVDVADAVDGLVVKESQPPPCQPAALPGQRAYSWKV